MAGSPLVFLPLVVLLSVPAPALAQDTPQDAPHPQATAAVQVTTNPDPVRAHAAPLIDVNPQTGELVIVEIEGRTTKRCGVHVSADDGRRWFRGGDLAAEPYTDCASDPVWSNNIWLDFASDGTLYVAFIAHDPDFNDRDREGVPRHIFLARSEDSGRSFETTRVFEAPENADDTGTVNRLPQVAVDPTDASRVYVSWQQGGFGADSNPALVAASDDGGRAFAEPVNVADGLGSARHPRLAVDGDGVVHAIVPITDTPRRVYYRRSTDQGQTWSEAEELQRKDPEVEEDEDTPIRRNRKWQLEADPDSSGLYLTWYGSVDPAATLEGHPNNVYLQVSPDGGDSWQEPQLVNDDGRNEVDQYDPNVSIAPNGRVDIAWLDFRNSPYPEREEAGSPWNHGGFQDVYYSHSTDGGESLAPNARITDRLIDREIGVWSNAVHMHGHVGVASTDDTVYFAWQDTRNGDEGDQSEDVYFAAYHLDEAEPVAGTTGPAGGELWMVGVAALLFGMGAAMVLTWLLSRRGPRLT